MIQAHHITSTLKFLRGLLCGLAPNSCLSASYSGRMEAKLKMGKWVNPTMSVAALFMCSILIVLHVAVWTDAVRIQRGNIIPVLCSLNIWLWNFWHFHFQKEQICTNLPHVHPKLLPKYMLTLYHVMFQLIHHIYFYVTTCPSPCK